jgi:hypothetical protein
MIDPVDIFRLDSGAVRWLESAATVEHARARVLELMANSPGEQFLILDQQNGTKQIVTSDTLRDWGGNQVQDPESAAS